MAAVLAVGALALLTPVAAHAEEDFWGSINRVRQLFEINEYELALKRLEYAHSQAQGDEQRTLAALYDGLVLASLGRQNQIRAASAFRAGLLLTPWAKLPRDAPVPLEVEREFEEVQVRIRKRLDSPPPAGSVNSGPPAGGIQENFGSALRQVQQLLEHQEYEPALKQIKEAKQLARHDEQRVTVAFYEGIIRASWGYQQLNRATDSFRKVLQRSPLAKLPVKGSAAVERDFEEMRVRISKELAARPTASPDDKAHWKPTGSMKKAREAHTATLLGSGKVLVVGGLDATGPLADAELYDPASKTWTLTDSMSVGRSHHTATLLPSGDVLVVGGENYDKGVLATAELYHSTTGTWSSVDTMSTGRQHHTATLLSSGKVLVTGGEDASGDKVSSAEVYDPSTQRWSLAGSMSSARVYHQAIEIQPGKVLVTGGIGPNGYLSSSEVYDVPSGTWSAAGSLPIVLAEHKVIKLSSGKVVSIGGEDSDSPVSLSVSYSPSTGTWTPYANMSTGRVEHTVTELSSGSVLVTGGDLADSPAPFNAELYNPIKDSWRPTASMLVPRIRHTAVLLPSGEVLIAGGSNGDALLNSAELYQP